MSVQEKLDRLAELQARRTLLDISRQELINQVITPEIQARITEIDIEFSGQFNAADAAINALTDEIKADVIQAGESIKGAHLHAIYTKGRVSWDSKMLEGLMMVFPKLEEARKVGDPSVSIRKI